ncbi:hypothetical protein ACKGJN_02570 [Gillisia sp. Q332]|uniref:hypothetical protein n=1 Tax=Gillisia xinjiangensis TaxID=3384765 RepID=UPI00391896D8
MSSPENSVKIESDRIKIIEPKKPVRFMFLMILAISGTQGFFSLLKYIETSETGHLFIASFMIALFVLALIKEIFFVSYQNEIAINEVSKIRILPILFGRGTVFLEIKFRKKTRQVLLNKGKANKIMEDLNPLISL